MKCEVSKSFSFANNMPSSYVLLVGIIDDPELSMIAKVLIHGGQSVIPQKFFDVIPDLDRILNVEDVGSSFELIDIPARDFLTATAEEYGDSWQNTFDRFLIHYKDIYTAFCKLGEVVRDQMKLVIENHNWIENGFIMTEFKERTGGDPRPLINTGHMLHSITYKVIKS